MTSRSGSTVLWTSYDRPMRIDNGAGTTSYLWYGPHRQLRRQLDHSGGTDETTVYAGDLLEKVTKDGFTTWKHYVEAPTGTVAVYLRRSDGTADTYYLTHDHLGSTDKVLDAAGGVVTVEESFTALGARRGSDWQGTPTPAELAAIAATTRDGFTGHAMLDSVGLIHMRGRVYDPLLGRFLSVDPLVRDVTATQSWNGYGYVEGRALSATDPSGFVQVLEEIVVPGQRCSPHDYHCNDPFGKYLLSVLPTLGFLDQSLASLTLAEDGGAEAVAPPSQEQDQNPPQPPCTDGPSYMDRYMDWTSDHVINVGPYAAALAGGLWPKSWSLATGGRPPLLGSTNPLTSVPRAFGIPGADTAIARTGAAGIGLITVAIGFYDLGIELQGFVYAIPDYGAGSCKEPD